MGGIDVAIHQFDATIKMFSATVSMAVYRSGFVMDRICGKPADSERWTNNPMPELVIARVLHVLGVVLWIGGVGFVTTVLLPATRRLKTPQERIEFFETVERGFAWQARITTLLAGLTGLYLLYRMDLWQRFLHIEYWWMHAMVLTWALFTLMLFVLEPLFLHRRFIENARRDPHATFALVTRMHWILLVLSLITVAGAVAGSHGYLLFTR